jgi:hypothetical protein
MRVAPTCCAEWCSADFYGALQCRDGMALLLTVLSPFHPAEGIHFFARMILEFNCFSYLATDKKAAYVEGIRPPCC